MLVHTVLIEDAISSTHRSRLDATTIMVALLGAGKSSFINTVMVLGGSGTGKSSLINTVMGSLQPDAYYSTHSKMEAQHEHYDVCWQPRVLQVAQVRMEHSIPAGARAASRRSHSRPLEPRRLEALQWPEALFTDCPGVGTWALELDGLRRHWQLKPALQHRLGTVLSAVVGGRACRGGGERPLPVQRRRCTTGRPGSSTTASGTDCCGGQQQLSHWPWCAPGGSDSPRVRAVRGALATASAYSCAAAAAAAAADGRLHRLPGRGMIASVDI